jgi:putative superfamily III holin-X
VTNGNPHNGKTVAEVLHEFKDELKDFAITRVQIFRSEMKEKLGGWEAGLPALAIGIVLVVMTLFLFTGTLVALIAIAFNGAVWGYALAFAIVTVIYGATGAALGIYGWGKIRDTGVVPERTIKVLKEDGIWIQSEARTQV